MKRHEYTYITGLWNSENTKSIDDFINSVGLTSNGRKKYQLIQTYTECKIEDFDSSFSPDIKYLEQYRAFCSDWELWIRNINSLELRFRFILKGKIPEKVTISEDYESGKKTALVNEQKFPLWGKPLSFKNKNGWYTEQIPQIIDYPVDFTKDNKKRAYLKVENLLREDGTVEIVRYTGLEVS